MAWPASNLNMADETAFGASNAVVNAPGTAKAQLAAAVASASAACNCITNVPSWEKKGVRACDWTPPGFVNIHLQFMNYDKSYRI